jgi:ATP-dependent exoDNAse (exonuclease V) alpha subunit
MDNIEKIQKIFNTESNVVFLTGPGGTGKTYTINGLCDKIKNVARTATTGIAATHINGETIHRFASIGALQSPDSFYKIVNSSFFEEVADRIRSAEMVVIDEASMLHQNQFHLIDKVFAYACYSKKPFGGKKILLSGDFLQLPPVDKEGKSAWIFEGETWGSVNPKVIELTKIYRQEDKQFTETLMNIRNGIVTDEDDKLISSRMNNIPDDMKPVRFVSTNSEADGINLYHLNQADGRLHTFNAQIEIYDYKSEKHKKMIREQLIRDMIAQEKLLLKPGVQVMVLKNGSGYCNGSMGRVIDIKNDYVKVELKNGRVIFLESEEWVKLDSKDNPIATFRQIPLKLAYAITIHKSQGMTLDCCDIDFKRFFAPGQAYVALSRVKTLEGLCVRNWSKEKVFADEKALNFYRRHRGELL